MASLFVDNDGVRLHTLDNERDGAGVPVVTVPGLGEEADEYAWQLDELGDRRVVVVDVRGPRTERRARRRATGGRTTTATCSR